MIFHNCSLTALPRLSESLWPVKLSWVVLTSAAAVVCASITVSANATPVLDPTNRLLRQRTARSERAKRVKLGQIWHLPTTSPTKKPNAHHKDPAIAKLANANASLAMTGLHASSPVAQITAQARADASRRSTSRLKRSRPTPRHGMPIKSKVAYVMLAAVASTAP